MSVPRQAFAPLTHGGRSETALSRDVTNVKRVLLRRMGLRQAELTWNGREALDLYSRAKTKLLAMDRWFGEHGILDDEGQPAPALTIYARLLTVAARHLEGLRATVEQLAREDDRFDSAVQALIAEGRKTKAGREAEEQAP